MGFKPIARWVASGTAGCRPDLMGLGAGYALLAALKHAGISLKDLDVIECNEAFAAQNLAVIGDLEDKTGMKIDRSRWNPNGGAIASWRLLVANTVRLPPAVVVVRVQQLYLKT